MSYYWLLITISWLGSVALQSVITPSNQETMEPTHKDPPYETFRQRRFVEEDLNRLWTSNTIDSDPSYNTNNNDELDENQYLIQAFLGAQEENDTEVDKRSFSPWGGKRSDPYFGYTWSWKRASNLREPSMPKRVRFSPWGGKRSGQVVYKPTAKDFKYVSQYSVLGNHAGNRHPIQLLAVGIDGSVKESVPFKRFADYPNRPFRIGQPHSEIDLAKNGKRKAKFSAWGGKRSAPLIGPVWTPAPDDIKEALLDAILLIRNRQKSQEA